MKKTLLLTTLLLSSTSYANMYVKGGLSLAPSTDTLLDKANSVNWNITRTKFDDQGTGFNFGLGYQLTDSFSIELGLEKDKISMSYGLGFNVRLFKYNKFSLFTKANVGMVKYDDGILSAVDDVGDVIEYNLVESSAMKISLGLGVEYNINDKYSVYTSLERVEYDEITTHWEKPGIDGISDVGIAPHNQISVGAKYKF